jgi:hypothetical protein
MAEQKKKHKYLKVIVHRGQTGIDYGNAPIFVDCGMPSVPPKAFSAGVEVVLHESQVNVLRDAVISTEVAIPRNSGIYGTVNPIRAAESRNPGIKFKIDPTTGLVTGKKNVRCYIIEVIGNSTKKAFMSEFRTNQAAKDVDAPEPVEVDDGAEQPLEF